MTGKGYIISFSLAGTLMVAGSWVLWGEPAVSREGATFPVPAARVGPDSVPSEKSRPEASVPLLPAPHSDPLTKSGPATPLTKEELTARAARVEQEANHDLRRLVKLLDLSEEQQDRVFKTLAERSSSWTQGLQVAPANGVAIEGKRSQALLPAPVTGTGAGLYAKKPAAETPVPHESPAPGTTTNESADGNDPTMDEILAILDPYQQDTLLKAEMDRAAWWAEILPQITPPEDPPLLDGTPPPAPGAGQTKTYDGAEVLE